MSFTALLVDDNPDDRMLVARALRREFPQATLTQIADRRSFDEALEAGGFDLAVTDYRLRWSDGLEVFRRIRARHPDCPVILFTATGNEELAVRAMKEGLSDYILKSPRHFKRLPAAVRLALDLARTRREVESVRNERLRIFERITDGFVAIDRNWRYTYVNARAAVLLGRAPADLVGKHVWSEFPESVGHPFHAAIERAMERQAPEHIEEFYEPWGRWFENRIYPAPDGLSIFFTDITARKQSEAALHEVQERLRLAVQASQVGLWDWEIVANRVHYSDEWKRQLGYEPGELPDRFEVWEERLHPADRERVLQTLHAYLREPWARYEAEFRLRHRDGGYRWILTRAELVLDAEGRPARMFGCHIDVTEGKLAEGAQRALSRRLLRAQEEERRRIARELHDEIGQVLTAVKLNIEGLRRHVVPAATDRLERAVVAVDRGLAEVKNLALDLRPSLLDDLGLVPALRWCADRHARDTGMEVHATCDPLPARPPVEVETACFRITQEALTNVARHARASRVWIELRHSTKGLELLVRDDGAGFDPRAAGDGSLGLAGMRERASLAGGDLQLYSEPGGGTEVRATFPGALAGADEAERRP